MSRINLSSGKNERLKHAYFAFLKDAKGQSEATIDSVAKSLSHFESSTRHREFKAFHYQQAIAFKSQLLAQTAHSPERLLSRSTIRASLGHLKAFFQWLYSQPGYKSVFSYSDAEYFNLSEKDNRIASTRREQAYPTLEQMRQVLQKMPDVTEIEMRNRAIIALATISGIRVGALASLKLKHIDLGQGFINQDAREVNTKFAKTFRTYFIPIEGQFQSAFSDWVTYLREKKLWGNDDPLFPATNLDLDAAGLFRANGLSRDHWSNSTPIRQIFHEAFHSAGLPYFNPHSLRKTLVKYGMEICQGPEEFKAFSQNLGHENVLTTFMSYGAVDGARQGDLISRLRPKPKGSALDPEALGKAMIEMMGSRGFGL